MSVSASADGSTSPAGQGAKAHGAVPARPASSDPPRVRIWCDRAMVSARRARHCAMMTPFWGDGERPPWCRTHDVFRRYAARGGGYFTLVETPSEADVAVLPSTLHAYLADGTEAQAAEFAHRAEAAGLLLLVFHERDLDIRSPFANSLLFSPALEGRPGPREFGLPAWVEDHLEGPAPPRPWQAQPVIGFCGWVRRPDLPTRLRRWLQLGVPGLSNKRFGSVSASLRGEFRHYFLRRSLIERVEAHPGLRANFIARDRFFAGSRKPGDTTRDAAKVGTAQQEFIANTVNSDYVLCTRGKGNYSARLYETLAMGRLPIFVDTDCVLPPGAEADLRALMVTLDWREAARLPELLLERHVALDPGAFCLRQQEARRLWEERLSPDGFFRNLHLQLASCGITLRA